MNNRVPRDDFRGQNDDDLEVLKWNNQSYFFLAPGTTKRGNPHFFAIII